MNMTASEVMDATSSNTFQVISVWDHKTAAAHGPAKIALKEEIYQLLVQYMGSKTGADLVFTTSGGKRLTHIGL